ncbi:hypothetical protein V6N13_050560 [Hibiscus sabdariffa]
MKSEASSKPMGLTHDIFPKVQPHLYSWINRYGKNFLFWNGVRAELVISEPELIKEVLRNSERTFPKRKPTVYLSKLLGNGLVTAEGERWVKQRKLANHAFHGESLKNMIPAVIASVETMLAQWQGQEGEKIFAMLNKLSIIMSRNVFKTRTPFINKLWKPADLLEIHIQKALPSSKQ